MDFCTLGHDCHPNATCRNLKTSYICECNKGYWGNGRYCSDIDECIRNDGGIEGHKCKQNTKCINLPGTYRCECLPGYETTDGYTCQGKLHLIIAEYFICFLSLSLSLSLSLALSLTHSLSFTPFCICRCGRMRLRPASMSRKCTLCQ